MKNSIHRNEREESLTKIIFYYEDEYITLGYITSSNVEAFIDLLQRNSKTSTGL